MGSNKAFPESRASEILIAKRFVLIFLSALLLFLPSCRALVREVFKTPKVRVVSVKLSDNPFLTKDALDLVIHLEVLNPNSYALSVSQAVYSVTIGKRELISGEKNEQVRLEPSQETTVMVPITLNPGSFRAALNEIIEARAVPYEFNGSLEVDAPLVGIVRAPFSKTGVFDPLDLIRKKVLQFN
ncbi:MAG: LEA type 2 family protein [Syntrophorhabdaceae bacterium]|nr:LEA type 2 family protein [Syntrophorhabdaceae bacterium]